MDILTKMTDLRIDGMEATAVVHFSIFDPKTLERLKKVASDGKYQNMKFGRVSNDRAISYDLQKLWFKSIELILRKEKIAPTADALHAVSEDFKKQFLPVEYINVGERQIPKPPTVSYLKQDGESLNYDQFREGIKRLQETYADLGVNFGEYRID